MSCKTIFLLTLLSINSTILLGQVPINRRSLFIHAENQILNYEYLTVGLGYQPKKMFASVVRKNPKYAFEGWTISYIKKLNNPDWGASLQSIFYSGTATSPAGAGFEVNYKSINQSNHFSFKPLIGLSFPIVSLMYAYNFDFYKTKSERINQHEIILGLRIAVLREKIRRPNDF